jgi:hypothetical protein
MRRQYVYEIQFEVEKLLVTGKALSGRENSLTLFQNVRPNIAKCDDFNVWVVDISERIEIEYATKTNDTYSKRFVHVSPDMKSWDAP